MRHNRDVKKLNRTASHRKAMLRNMVTSLFAAERIQTTTAKAKEARRVAERMITFARRGDLAARRHVARTVQNPRVLKKLFDEIAPRYTDRPGGYTRVLKLGARKGDGAKLAMLELLGKDDEGRKKKKKPRKTYHEVEVPKSPLEAWKKTKEAAAAAAAEESAEAAVEAEAAEEQTSEEAPAPAKKKKKKKKE